MVGYRVIKRMLRRLGLGGKRGTTFVSFSKPLTQLCQQFPMDGSIVEFGPGFSTEIFLNHTGAEIVSFETNKLWYDKYKAQLDPKRVKLILKEPGWNLDEIGEYGDKFSFFFVDGGDRVEALKTAFDLLDEQGMVYLHDAHREVYEPGIRLYPYVYCPERHSCILFKSQALRDAVKASIPADYSCRCQYCSSEERRSYFAQYIDEPTPH